MFLEIKIMEKVVPVYGLSIINANLYFGMSSIFILSIICDTSSFDNSK